MTLLILYVLVFPAAALLASKLQHMEDRALRPDLRYAGFIILFVAVLYAAAVVLGTLSGLSLLYVALASAMGILLLRREWVHLSTRSAAVMKELGRAITQFPPLLFALLLFVLFHVGSPMQAGDSLVYHLPNVWNMVETASTLALSADQLYDPNAVTAFYPRGMETLYALFYLFPLPTMTIVLFKLLFFATLYFLIKSTSHSRLIAAIISALLLSTSVVWHDLSSLKNDLPLALALTYATTVLVVRRGRRLPFISFTAAIVLAISMKANAVFYLACLCPLWFAQEYRHPRRFMLCIAAVTLFGGFFYWVNIAQFGTPFPPYGVHVLGVDLFKGESNPLWQTTLIANIDPQLPRLFLRGLVLRLGPAGALLLLATMALALYHGMRAMAQDRELRIRKTEYLYFLLYIVGYILTPFSDRNGPEVHGQLVSGHTIRMLLPFMLIFAVVASRLFASALRGRRSWLPLLHWGTTAIICIDLFVYDLITLLSKPTNAFAGLAPLCRTFDNQTLGIALVAVIIVCFALSRLRKPLSVPIVLVTASFIFISGYPSSVSYTMRFKQIGRTTDAFEVIQNNASPRAKVAVLGEKATSHFVGCMNDVLMKESRKVRFVTNTDRIQEFDMFVVCASDRIESLSNTQGRRYDVTMTWRDHHKIPDPFRLVYKDDFYVIYAKNPAPEYSSVPVDG